MKSQVYTAALLCALTAVAGCASTQVTQQTPMVSQAITRPNQIWVYDFVATRGDVGMSASVNSRPETTRMAIARK